MRYLVPLILVAITLEAGEIEISTPGGVVKIRVRTEEEREERARLDLSTPQAAYFRAKEDIRILRKIYTQKLYSSRDRREVLSILDELEDLILLLYSMPAGKIEVVEKEEGPKPMSESAFNALIEQLREETFDEDKLSILKVAAKNNYFTCEQIARIMDEFSMDEDKVEVVRIMFPKAVDKENGFKLLSKVTYSEDKEKIKEIISQ